MMGIFSMTPMNKKERKLYDTEKKESAKLYEQEKTKARNTALKAQARMDALPRTVRAKQRLTKGLSALKTGAKKFQAWDAKNEAQYGNSGLIANGYKQDFQRAKTSQPLVQQSMNGQQGEGLLIQSLRGSVKRQR